MSIVEVQHASNLATFTSGTSGTVNVTISAATAGNCLVANVNVVGSAGTPSVSGVKTGSNVENWAKGVEVDDATNTACSAIWVDPNTAGGGTTVAVTVAFNATATTTNSVTVMVDAFEFSGVVTSSPVDKTTTGATGQTSTSWSSGTTSTISQASEVLIGTMTATAASGSTTVTGPSSPWTNESVISSTVAFSGTSFDCYALSGYQIVSSTGTATYNGTTSSSSIWDSVALTLKGAASSFTIWNGTIPSGTSPVSTSTRNDGVLFTVSAASTLTEIAFYVPATETTLAGSSYTAQLWTTTTGFTGTLVTSNAGTGTFTAGAWNWITLTSPVSLTTGVNYIASVVSPDLIQFLHFYWETGNPGAAGIVSGPINVPGTASAPGLSQQSNSVGSVFPQPSSTQSWFGIDVMVTTSGGGGGTAHTSAATLATTPTFLATRIHGRKRSATLGVTPKFSAGGRYIAGISGSGTGQYFVDNTGAPRMILGDAAWALPGNAGRWNSGNWQADYDTFFANRAAQGYTVIYLKPIGTTQSGNIDDNGSTFDGLYPFQGGTPSTGVAGANPSTGLTAAFWARIDYMFNSAMKNGITIFFNAIGYDSDFSSGPGPLFGKSTTEFTAYGTAMGTRYAAQGNLMWNLADDYFGENDALITAFMTGVRGAGDTHLVSIENYPETTSRQDLSTSAALPWGTSFAEWNNCYSYNVTYYGIEKAYLESSPLAVIQLDGYFYQGGPSGVYSGGSGAFAYDRASRQDAWHALSSGARGVVQGSEGIWQWTSTSLSSSGTEWYYVNNAGVLRSVMESLSGWNLLVPDTSSALVTSGRGTHATSLSSGGGGGQYEVAFTDTYISASRTPDSGSGSSLAVIYFSHATTIGIDQTKMVSGYTATWVDPVSGAKHSTTPGASYNSATPGNNSKGDPDWVLVLARASAHTSAATLVVTPTLTAGRKRGHVRNAVKAVTPSFVSNRIHGHGRHVSLAVSPTFTAGRARGRVRSALKTITPSFASTRIHGHGRFAALAASPVFSAVAHVTVPGASIVRSAIKAVTPGFVANRIHGHGRRATTALTPTFTTSPSHGHGRHATLGVIPTLLATGIVQGANVHTFTASVAIACNAYGGLNSDLTISARAGAPYQGNMRQLAFDRWNYMYPSE